MEAIRPSSCALSALLTLLATGSLTGQTYIVDAQNGAGASYTDLPAAIAGVPSGATLRVRAGSYSPFQIANKSLRIIGEKSASGFPLVRWSSGASALSIGPLSTTQSVTVSGLGSTSATPSPASVTVDVTGCAGPVLLEDVSFDALAFFAPIYLHITNSANVHLARVQMISVSRAGVTAPIVVQNSSVEFSRLIVVGYTQMSLPLNGTNALEAQQRSNVVLIDSSITGGHGFDLSSPGGTGGAGVVLSDGSTLHLFANANSGAKIVLQGGSGGTGTPTKGAGGAALVSQQGSRARVLGLTPLGGAGLPAGQVFVNDATSTLDYKPGDIVPTAGLVGTVQPSNTVKYTLYGRPGSAAGLLLGFDAQLQMVPPLALGALGLNLIVSIGPVVVPPNGTYEFLSLVPASWPTNTVLLAQYVVYDSVFSEIRASNLFTATSRF